MTSQEMADRILDLVALDGDATFPGIIHSIGEEARGDRSLDLAPNTIAWSGISKTLFDAFALINDKLEVRKTSVMVNAVDGAMLNIPIGKSIRKGGYKRPHWIPVLFEYRDKNEAAKRRALLQSKRSSAGKPC